MECPYSVLLSSLVPEPWQLWSPYPYKGSLHSDQESSHIQHKTCQLRQQFLICLGLIGISFPVYVLFLTQAHFFFSFFFLLVFFLVKVGSRGTWWLTQCLMPVFPLLLSLLAVSSTVMAWREWWSQLWDVLMLGWHITGCCFLSLGWHGAVNQGTSLCGCYKSNFPSHVCSGCVFLSCFSYQQPAHLTPDPVGAWNIPVAELSSGEPGFIPFFHHEDMLDTCHPR